MLYNRRKLSFTRLFGPGFHIEGQDTVWDRRLKGTYFRHFRYFGPRGEFLIYAGVICLVSGFLKRNFKRQDNIEALFNDRNVFFKLELPYEKRKINNQ
jgi:hypothetical protein